MRGGIIHAPYRERGLHARSDGLEARPEGKPREGVALPNPEGRSESARDT